VSNFDIAIRADGTAKTGTGHIHRTMALAGYLKQNFKITFYLHNSDKLVEELLTKNNYSFTRINAESELLSAIDKNTIVVLDGYNFDKAYQEELRTNGNKVVMIDDLRNGIQVADIVLNHGYTGKASDYGISEGTRLYSGPKYALLKNEFFNFKSESPKRSNKNVLVCIGGTDPKNYSEKIINELLKETDKSISLITYPINPNFEKLKALAPENNVRLSLYHSLSTVEMIDLISKNDIAILQPSNIAFECACIGIYMCLIQTEENQKYIKETLLNNDCAVELNSDQLLKTIHSISIDDINSQIENQRNIFDGRSPARLLSVFNSLLLKPRRAKVSDVDMIFEWSNDKVTRENSYEQGSIPYEDHVAWFNKKIEDKNSCFLIFDWNNDPAGTVRFDVKEKETVIGINVAPNYRDKKLSSSMLELACHYFFKHFKENSITAYIKKTNEASLKSFVSAGFEIQDLNNYFGSESYKLIKKR
jgi:UDP-2,4-diacetamido-2,4,6-trideoxy-beta-L-altropyranose hydrolase